MTTFGLHNNRFLVLQKAIRSILEDLSYVSKRFQCFYAVFAIGSQVLAASPVNLLAYTG